MADYTLHFVAAAGGWSYQFSTLTPAVHWGVTFDREGKTDRVNALVETWTIDGLFYGDVADLFSDYEALVAKLEALEPFHVQLKYGGSVKRELRYQGTTTPSHGRRCHTIRVISHEIIESPGGKANNLHFKIVLLGKQYVSPAGDDGSPPEWIRRSHSLRNTPTGKTESWDIWVKSNSFADAEPWLMAWREEYRAGRDLTKAEFTENIDEGTFTASFVIEEATEGGVFEWKEEIRVNGGGLDISFLPMSDGKLPSTVIGPVDGYVVEVYVNASADTEKGVKELFKKNYRKPNWSTSLGGWASEQGNVVPGKGICIPTQKDKGRGGSVRHWKIQYSQKWKFNSLEEATLIQFGLAKPTREEPKSRYTPIWGNP